jgi:hypothetical protein
MGCFPSRGLYKSDSMRARSFVVFPVFSIVVLVSVSLEMPELVLVSSSLCRDAQTPSGCLSFSFRFGLWNQGIYVSHQQPLLTTT